MPTYANLDALPSFARLRAAPPVSLRKVLSSARVDEYRAPMAAGLEYLYAAMDVDDAILDLLQSLADEAACVDKFAAIASGEVMNPGEKRMVLHHLARGEPAGPVVRDGRDFRAFYEGERKRIAAFARDVRSGTIAAKAGNFDTVVQIGIGGSDLGPRALYLALERQAARSGLRKLRARFISNVDPDDANAVLDSVNLGTTLFILVSKSGTTQETLANEAFVKAALRAKGLDPARHMVAVTSETSPLARNPGYLASFYIDDYIGGRYSGSSAVGGVVLSLAFGPETFEAFLEGARDADLGALERDARRNAALLDALIGVYERNVRNRPATAILPYEQALERFPAHLQQLDMESNGKSVNRAGQPVSYATGPVVFGEPGTNGQHSFYQLLHQGTDVIPLQFIGFLSNQSAVDLEFEGATSRRTLNANLAAQIVAFALGKDDADPNRRFAGERPSSLIVGDELGPRQLGALLAHYENKVMFQGFLWNLNSFDQEGVQLGKALAKRVLGDGAVDATLEAFAKATGAR